jgi:hypothetical protein
MKDLDVHSPLALETLRLYRRYQLEIVEALNLCPWAKRSRLEGHVRERVYLESAPAVEDLLPQLDDWSADASVEIGLMLFPTLEVNRSDFEQFATATMAADARRHHLTSPDFVLAAFHPDAPLNRATRETLIPFWRRTPDPTLQVVRVSALERVRRGESSGTQFVELATLDLTALKAPTPPALRERVAQSNLETLEQIGWEKATRMIEAIHLDHRQTRGRLSGTRNRTSGATD